MKTAFRNKYRLHDPVWHVQLAVLAALVLQLFLPDRFVFGSRYVLLATEALLLVAMSFTTPKERIFRSISRRINVLLLIVLTSVANIYSVIEITRQLLQTGHIAHGRELVLTALNIFLTNIIIFALWYWEMDGGGPGRRLAAAKYEYDFLFPQNRNEEFRHPDWRPTFIDYLYVSSTNAMTFGPADTKPLSRRAKLLMLTQATVSLAVVALVAARAISILT
ncbi:MAG TPA: DUF1345 domain-containing protein [Candidatus Saccharimonadales bacterium]|nr:DUF1345 domain-containing protein [Candidatus Saccharimonadales bacterium]